MGSPRVLILLVTPEHHLQKLWCVEGGRSFCSALLPAVGLRESQAVLQFLLLGLSSFPGGKEGKAPQKLCTPGEDLGPGYRALCVVCTSFSVLSEPRLNQPWCSPSPSLLFWLLPFLHTSASRDPFLCLQNPKLATSSSVLCLTPENDTATG